MFHYKFSLQIKSIFLPEMLNLSNLTSSTRNHLSRIKQFHERQAVPLSDLNYSKLFCSTAELSCFSLKIPGKRCRIPSGFLPERPLSCRARASAHRQWEASSATSRSTSRFTLAIMRRAPCFRIVN